jgi:hypothetical protein
VGKKQLALKVAIEAGRWDLAAHIIVLAAARAVRKHNAGKTSKKA